MTYKRVKLSPEKVAYLNVGCGGHFVEGWNNLDFHARPGVDAFDIRAPLPYADESFDVVYSSHVLEHLTPDAAHDAVREQYRVLKPGGICRIVVPDLERICRCYLEALDMAAKNGSSANFMAYDWSVLQLLDQLVRDQAGGEMQAALARGYYDRELVTEMFGDEFADILRAPGAESASATATPIRKSVLRTIYRSIRPPRPRSASLG